MIPTEFIGFARSQHPIELEGEVREGGGGWVSEGVSSASQPISQVPDFYIHTYIHMPWHCRLK